MIEREREHERDVGGGGTDYGKGSNGLVNPSMLLEKMTNQNASTKECHKQGNWMDWGLIRFRYHPQTEIHRIRIGPNPITIQGKQKQKPSNKLKSIKFKVIDHAINTQSN